MKKLLLFLAAVLAFTGVNAQIVDPDAYESVNDLNVQNLWVKSRFHTRQAYLADHDLGLNNYARSAVMHDGIVYIANSSQDEMVIGTDTLKQVGRIVRFDAVTGEKLEPLMPTLNGTPIHGLLCINQIGVDNFGHFWIIPYTSETNAKVPVYLLNEKTGELTQLYTLDKGEPISRLDYADVIGDITLKEAECNIISPGSNTDLVYAWHNDQGGNANSWDGFFGGLKCLKFLSFWPEKAAGWSTAPTAKWLVGDEPGYEYAGDLFYVDGHATWPTLYDFEGTIIDSFQSAAEDIAADPLLAGDMGANGITEFYLDDRHFIAYPEGQYENGHTCQVNIVELGEGDAFAGMKRYWTLPYQGLGNTTDSGTRIHVVATEDIEVNGEPAVRLLTMKCNNGIAVYQIGKGVEPTGETPVPHLDGDVNCDGSVNAGDVSSVYSFMLGSSDDDNVKKYSDVNGDKSVNAGDVSAVYNIMLSGN